MLDVFMALLGGPYSVGKILADKSELKHNKQAWDNRRETWESRFQAWKVCVEDRALQEDLWYYVTKHENREAVWMEIKDAYREMPHHRHYVSYDDWVYDGALDRTKAGRKRYSRHRFLEPHDIMLARRGKLRSTVILNPVAYLAQGMGEKSKREWDCTLEFWVYIQHELQKHGVDARLLFERHDEKGQPTGEFFDANNKDEFAYKCGNLVWLPATWVDSNLNPL